MANKKDFATAFVANNPGVAGTNLELVAGYGAAMPDLPFYLTLSPPGELTTLGNSEKVLVTANPSTDNYTMTRAQGDTTAQDIAADWIAVNAVYTEDVGNVSIITNEVPGGTVNGTNDDFTTASAYQSGSLKVFKNGVRMKGGGADYTEVGGGFTMVTPPVTGTVLLVDYLVGGSGHTVGSNSHICDETPVGTINSSNDDFTTARGYIGGTLVVYLNGIRQTHTSDYTETTPASGTFSMVVAPTTGDVLRVDYQYNLNPSSNADTVDGIHANTTATANQLHPLDSSAKLDASTFPTQESWQSVTFSGSWVNFGGSYETVQYMKDSLGFVHLKGVMKSGTIGASGAFTLPAGYRPGAIVYTPTASNGAFGVAQISSAGVLSPVVGSNVSFGLSGIIFKAEN